jgi:hypothetical protein
MWLQVSCSLQNVGLDGPCGAGALAREGSGRGTTSVVPNKQEKKSGTANPPDQPKSTPPAHFSFSNRSAARSILSQVMESFSILTLP